MHIQSRKTILNSTTHAGESENCIRYIHMFFFLFWQYYHKIQFTPSPNSQPHERAEWWCIETAKLSSPWTPTATPCGAKVDFFVVRPNHSQSSACVFLLNFILHFSVYALLPYIRSYTFCFSTCFYTFTLYHIFINLWIKSFGNLKL